MSKPADTPPERLAELQRRFAGHLRDPSAVPAPEGLEDRRLAIYRRLFFGNLDNLFSKNFPVLRGILDDARWKALVRHFMIEHRPTTPMFTRIGREFVRFLEQAQPNDLPPFALELAHWEFLETTVRLAEADPGAVEADEHGDLLAAAPRINPTLQLAEYRWPVHEIGPDRQPRVAPDQPTILAAWRRRNDRTGFMRLNRVTARLLALADERPGHSGRALLEAVAAEMNAPDVEAIVRAGHDALDHLRKREVVLGTRPAQAQ